MARTARQCVSTAAVVVSGFATSSIAKSRTAVLSSGPERAGGADEDVLGGALGELEEPIGHGGVPACDHAQVRLDAEGVEVVVGGDGDRGALRVPETTHIAVDLPVRRRRRTGMIQRWR